MAVTHHFLATGALLAGLAISTSVASQEQTEPGGADLDLQVIALAKRDLNQAAARLSATIDSCNGRAAASPIPDLRKVELTMLRAKGVDLRVGLGHLGATNLFECERDARLVMAFAAGNLAQVMHQLDLPLAADDLAQQALAFPPTDQLRYRAQYSGLTPELRHYLETVIGSEPFDLHKTLAAHGLTEPNAPAMARATANGSEPLADDTQPAVAAAAQ